jgi:uncharacterized SAM-binding protein YcdF (DUF218 family)
MRIGSMAWQREAFALLLVLLLLPEVALLGFFTAGAVLSSPAGLPHRADVVVVLGGGDGARYARGRELIEAGLSDHLLLINATVLEREDALGSLKNVEVLLDDLPVNSWQEAQAVRANMQLRGWNTALVVSDPPHLLRVSYAWASNFWGTRMSYTLIASNPLWWSTWHWWANPQSTTFVESEVLKLGYYVLRYRFGFAAD